MIDDTELTEALFGTKKKKRSRQTRWNEDKMFEQELQSEISARELTEKHLKLEKPVPIDPDDPTVVNTKSIRLARKLTYGQTKSIPVSEYMQKLREQYLVIYKQPKWADVSTLFGKNHTVDSILSSSTSLSDALQNSGTSSSSVTSLPKGFLNIRGLPRANKAKPSKVFIIFHFVSLSCIFLECCYSS